MAETQVLEATDSQQDVQHEAIVKLLSRPTTYPERTLRVLVKETHISQVFLTDRFAYKLKKPVCFEFADFRTLEARRQACEAEVRLNRRMAPDVYRGVVPITAERNGRLRLGGDGEPVDWVVKMRRLSEDRMLDQLLESGRLRSADLDRLATRLVDFYHHAPPLLLQPEQYRAEFEHHVRANRAELLAPRHDLPESLVRRVHTAQVLLLQSSPEMLTERVCDGRVIDGHGDLRPEHVCLDHPLAVFDCLEFSPELRRLDVLDELCFLAMECDYLGADFVGRQVINTYLQRTGDSPPAKLLWFYKCYRACVRAKVAALRGRQLAADNGPSEAKSLRRTARNYLDLAGRYSARLATPFVAVIRGLMGSGKTTLATALAETLGTARLGTDDLRQELYGASPNPAAYNAALYTSEARQRVYDKLLARCRRLLAQGESVVLDGAFLSAKLLRRVQALAENRAGLLVATCRCPTETARQRVAMRYAGGEDSSEARPELLDRQQIELERVPPHLSAVDIDTTASLNAQGNLLLQQLGHLARRPMHAADQSTPAMPSPA